VQQNVWFSNMGWFGSHALPASVVLVLQGLQFRSDIRRKWPRVHRIVGRILVLLITVGAISAFQLGRQTFAGTFAKVGYCLLAVYWIVTALAGFYFIRIDRDIARHRDWMTRNYTATLSAFTLRLFVPIAVATKLDWRLTFQLVAWGAWLPQVLAVEYYLFRRARTSDVNVVDGDADVVGVGEDVSRGGQLSRDGAKRINVLQGDENDAQQDGEDDATVTRSLKLEAC
jgi:uncharacterized membrane protein